MRNKKTALMFLGLVLCGGMLVMAEDKSSEEKKLDKAAVELDSEAGKPEGNTTVTDKLKTEFKVDDARIQGLRDQKLGYGEISIALSLAQGLPGGITDANVQKVMALRQGPPVMGWGKIAKELGVNLGSVTSKVKKVSSEAKKQEKADKMKKTEKGGKAEKPARHEKMERPERPEKGARPEGRGKR